MTAPNGGSVSVDIVPDTTGFESAVRRALSRMRPINIRVSPDTTGFRAAIQAAVAGMSIDIPVDVDTRAAAASMANFRRSAGAGIDIQVNLKTPSGPDPFRSTVGRPIDIPVDLDTRQAMASYALLRAIVSRPIDIPVDLDTRAAAASLAALRAAMAGLNGQIGGPGGLGGAAGRAGSRLQALIRIGATLAPLIVPAAAAATAAVVALGAAAAVAGAALATAVLGFSGIGGALSALRAPKTGGGGGGGADQAAQLARARADALLAVQAAQRGLETAELDAAEAAIQSSRRIESADRALLRAQRDLTAARDEAIRKLEDLALANRRAAVDSEANQIALRRAQAELENVNFDESKTDDERRSAALAVERAKLAIDEQTLANGRLKTETEAATKAGVDGAQSVLDAQQALADAERDRLDVSREVGRQQRDTAISLLEANLALEASQRDYIDALNDTGTAGAGGIDKVAEAMKKLSPAGREFVYFLHREVMPAIDRLKYTAQESMLPGVQAAIRSLFPLFGEVNELVAAMGKALGQAAQTIAASFASPAGLALLDYLTTEGPKIIGYITEIATALGEIGSILIVAFGSTTDQIFAGLASSLRDFATWLAKAVNTPEFLEFLAYIRENGPQVMRLLGALAIIFIEIGTTLAPLGELLLDGLVAAFSWLASLDGDTIVAIIGVIAFVIFALTGSVTALVIGVVALVALFVKAWPQISAAVVTAWDWMYANAFAPIGRFFSQTIPGWLSSLGNWWNNTWASISSWTVNAANSIWTGVSNAFRGMYNSVTGWTSNVLSYVSTSFNSLVGWIGNLPGRISAAVSGMFNAIPNAIKGALNTAISYWNAFASRMSIGGFGLPSLSFFASGGIVPGYTPGRDTTIIGVGGGEAVMRPEWTRAVGAEYVNAANAAARAGGTSGVQKFLESFGTPRFATGGIVPSNLGIASPMPTRRDTGQQPIGQGQPLVGTIVLNGARSATRSDARLIADEMGWQVRTGVVR